MKLSKYTFILYLSLINTVYADCDKKAIASIFPQYDWMREISKGALNGPEIILLEKNGADMHSYQPSVADVKSIIECDLIVYIGGESDEWIEKTLERGGNQNRRVLNLLEALGENAIEDDDGDKDEHIWFSLRVVALSCEKIAEKLSEIDPENAGVYFSNAAKYCGKLQKLDAEYRNALSKAKRKKLIVADRNPFGYLSKEYSIDVKSAFSGCGAEIEASFKTILALAKEAEESGASAIAIVEENNWKLADAVRRAMESKDKKIIKIDSMQSISCKDLENGSTYLGIMKSNLPALVNALE